MDSYSLNDILEPILTFSHLLGLMYAPSLILFSESDSSDIAQSLLKPDQAALRHLARYCQLD